MSLPALLVVQKKRGLITVSVHGSAYPITLKVELRGLGEDVSRRKKKGGGEALSHPSSAESPVQDVDLLGSGYRVLKNKGSPPCTRAAATQERGLKKPARSEPG